MLKERLVMSMSQQPSKQRGKRSGQRRSEGVTHRVFWMPLTHRLSTENCLSIGLRRELIRFMMKIL